MTLTIKEPLELGSLTKTGVGSDDSQGKAAENPRSNPVCLEVLVTVRSLPAEKDSGASGGARPLREERAGPSSYSITAPCFGFRPRFPKGRDSSFRTHKAATWFAVWYTREISPP